MKSRGSAVLQHSTLKYSNAHVTNQKCAKVINCRFVHFCIFEEFYFTRGFPEFWEATNPRKLSTKLRTLSSHMNVRHQENEDGARKYPSRCDPSAAIHAPCSRELIPAARSMDFGGGPPGPLRYIDCYAI